MKNTPEGWGRFLRDGSGIIATMGALAGVGFSIASLYLKTKGTDIDFFPIPAIAEGACFFGGLISLLQLEGKNTLIGAGGLSLIIFLQEWIKRI